MQLTHWPRPQTCSLHQLTFHTVDCWQIWCRQQLHKCSYAPKFKISGQKCFCMCFCLIFISYIASNITWAVRAIAYHTSAACPGARFNKEVQPTLSLNFNSELTYSEMGNSEFSVTERLNCVSLLSRLTLSLARAPRLWKVMISGAPKLRFTMATAPAKKTSERILPSMRNFNS